MKLLHLSDDMLISILARCDSTADVVAFAGVCRRARQIASHPNLWRNVAVPAPCNARSSGGRADSDEESSEDEASDSDCDFEIGAGSSKRGRGKNESERRDLKRSRKDTNRRKDVEVCPALCAIERCTTSAVLAGRGATMDKSVLESLDLSMLGGAGEPLGRKGLELLAYRAGRSLKSFDCPPSSLLRHEDLETFAHSCPNLRSLTLHGVDHATLVTVRGILHERSNIVRIGMIECRNIRGGAVPFWRAISAVAGRLESIDITGCPISALPVREMMQHCTALSDFTADRCRHLCPPAVMPQMEDGPNQQPGTGFEKLAWIRVDFSENDWTPFLSWIFEKYGVRGNLRALSLNARVGSHLSAVSSRAFDMSLPPLEHLALSGQADLVDDFFFCDVVIDRLSLHLRTLDLSKAPYLTGSWEARPGWKFPLLEQLDLSMTKLSEVCFCFAFSPCTLVSRLFPCFCSIVRLCL